MYNHHFGYYDKNKFFLSALPQNYFKELLKAKVDPDNIDILYENTINADYEFFVKRRKSKKLTSRILTQKPEFLNFVNERYCPSGSGVELVGSKEYMIRSSRIKINRESNAISINTGEDLPTIEYFFTPNEAIKSYQARQDPLFNVLNKIDTIPIGTKPTEFKADINILPKEYLDETLIDRDRIYLVFFRGEQKWLSKFNTKCGVYKCFPHIDYRFSKYFKFKNKLLYPLELYLENFIVQRGQIISSAYKFFTEYTVKVVMNYIDSNSDFRPSIRKMLNYFHNLSDPKNKFEYLLLHNSIEFIKFIKEELSTKKIIGTNVIDQVISHMSKLKYRACGIEVADSSIKGNINKFPNNRRYLFYSLSVDDPQYKVATQHEIPLQDKLDENSYLLRKDQKRINQIIKHFRNEVKNDMLSRPSVLELRHNSKEVEFRLKYFEEERLRLDCLNDSLKEIDNKKGKEKTNFYLMLKKLTGDINKLEEDDEIFDGFLENYRIKKRRPKKYISPVESNSKTQGVKYLVVALFVLIQLYFICLNIALFFESTKGSSKSNLDSFPLSKQTYVVEKALAGLKIDYLVYKNDLATANLEGLLGQTIKLNKNYASIGIKLYRSDVDKFVERYDLVQVGDLQNFKLKQLEKDLVIDEKVIGKKNDFLWKTVIGEIVRRQVFHLVKLNNYNELLDAYEESDKNENDHSKREKVVDNMLMNIEEIIKRNWTKHSVVIAEQTHKRIVELK